MFLGIDFESAWSILVMLAMVGFTAAVVVAVIAGAVRVGWTMAPWILIGAFIIWLINGFGV